MHFTNESKKPITVAFRFDDPSVWSSKKIEQALIRCFERHQMRATFAVIPFSKSDQESTCGQPISARQAKHLIEAHSRGIIEIALHGYSHEVRHPYRDERQSEFAGLSYEEQRALIMQGHDHLQKLFGNEINGFVPPWNSYDVNTLRALYDVGFKYVSAGLEEPLNFRQHLCFLPCSCGLRGLKSAVEEAARWRHLRPLIVILMHHYDFTESGEDNSIMSLSEFATCLGWLQTLHEVEVNTLSEVAYFFPQHFTARRLSWLARISALHWRLRSFFPRYSYPSVSFLTDIPKSVMASVKSCRNQ